MHWLKLHEYDSCVTTRKIKGMVDNKIKKKVTYLHWPFVVVTIYI